MDIRSSETPCKIRKRRFPTASSSSFANNNLSQFLVEKIDSPGHEKWINRLDRSTCEEDEVRTMGMRKSGDDDDDQVNGVFEKSITNVDRSRNKSRSSPGRGSAPQEKSRACGEIEPLSKHRGNLMLKPTHGLDEIKHSLTVSKEILKLLTHVWTTDMKHDSTSISLTSTLNHELNKARSHVNKLIQQKGPNNTIAHESKEQDKIRFAVKTIARELETERKLRRQTERMNKRLGRELASTKSSLAKAIKKAESEKQATKVLEQLCEKMASSMEEDRVELEELKRESERVRKEMEEEREMLRVADLLREERVHMKLIDAKHEYEDKHKQVNILVRDLKEELLEADKGIDHITPQVLSWYKSTNDKGENKTKKMTMEDTARWLWYNKEKYSSKVENDENAHGEEARGLSWFEDNKGEVVNVEMTNTPNEVIGRNSDCIELEFGLDMKNGSEDLNECSEERVLGFPGSSTMKEYEDEMERYKMIKDLRDRIVSGSDLSRDTIDFGCYM